MLADGTNAIAWKRVTRATAAPCATRASSASARSENGAAEPAERSAPSSARAWPRTASRRSSVKELTATSAATPTETDAVSIQSRPSEARLSRLCAEKRTPIWYHGIS